jgi:hypothetical protein
MKRLMILLASAVVAAVLLLPASASAAYTNAECLSCHDYATGAGAVSTVDFSAGGSVDYSKCRACHWISKAALTHGNFSHDHVIGKVFPSGYKLGGPKCTPCHFANAAGTGDLTRVMTTQTVDGWFATPNPRSLSASQLHTIHVNGSWPKTVLYTQGCSSCHSAAPCTSCHVIPPTAHADHTKDPVSGTYTYPPLSYKVGIGTPLTMPDLATERRLPRACRRRHHRLHTRVSHVPRVSAPGLRRLPRELERVRLHLGRAGRQRACSRSR